MGFTQGQLDALEEAIASGTLSVQYGDKKVTYQSMADMLKARELIRRELGLTKAKDSRIYPTVSKDLGGSRRRRFRGGSCDGD
jgi:hypothetical protein